MGYVHISPEYYINKGNAQVVGAGDIQKIDGAANLFKGNQASLLPDLEAHRWYFTAVYTCDAKKKRGKLQMRGVDGELDVIATF